jgi:DNA-binding MarR family transcriptional regulator
MKPNVEPTIPIGTQALILSKYYYGALTKMLEGLDVERYFSILYFLAENHGCSQQFICNHLAVDKTAMVKIIDFLIRSGYIKRTVNPSDRREHFILLTGKGKKQSNMVVNAFTELEERMFSRVKKQERAIFVKVLERTIENVKLLPSNDIFFNYKKTSGRLLTTSTVKRKRAEHKKIKTQ